MELPSTHPHPDTRDRMPKKSGLLTHPSAMSNGVAASSAAVAPHSPATTALASDAVEMLARDPAWPGHALAHTALRSSQRPAGSTSLKHLTLPAGRNQPAGHALLGEGVNVLLGVAKAVTEPLGVLDGVLDCVEVLEEVAVVVPDTDEADAVLDAVAELVCDEVPLVVLERVPVAVRVPVEVAERVGDDVADEVGKAVDEVVGELVSVDVELVV